MRNVLRNRWLIALYLTPVVLLLIASAFGLVAWEASFILITLIIGIASYRLLPDIL